jgi:hypothetical protein
VEVCKYLISEAGADVHKQDDVSRVYTFIVTFYFCTDIRLIDLID